MNLEKYGKYKWEYDKGCENQYDCYFQFKPELIKWTKNGYLDLELRYIDWNQDDVGNPIEPTYYLEMWCDDEYWVYKTNNLNNCRGVLNKFVKKIIALINKNALSWYALCKVGEKLHKMCDERQEKEKIDKHNKKMNKWIDSIYKKSK